MATEPATTDQAFQGPAAFEEEARREGGYGGGPWKLGVRRLRRNKVALFFGFLFVLLVAACLAAPLWSEHVAHTGPSDNHLTDTIVVDGERTDVVALDGTPIGPTWQGEFFLGADKNGRDVMVRLLYGGRNSLVVALALGGLQLGPIAISGDSLLIPIFVIGLVYVPYMARPVRGQVLSLREKEFVEAARAQGASPLRIMFGEVLPNLASTLLVFFTLLIANEILLEAALSFLGAGIRPPNPSWGTMIDEGVERIATAPHLTIVPGIMLVVTVLSLNVFGDGVRDALDPRAKVRLEH